MLFYINLDKNKAPVAVPFRRLESWLQLYTDPDTEFAVKEWARSARCRNECPVESVNIQAVAPRCAELDKWQWEELVKDLTPEQRNEYMFWRNSFVDSVNMTLNITGRDPAHTFKILSLSCRYLAKFYDLPDCEES